MEFYRKSTKNCNLKLPARFRAGSPKNTAGKPHLTPYLIKEPVQSIKSVPQLYDPRYGMVGPEAVGSADDTGTLSFALHTQ